MGKRQVYFDVVKLFAIFIVLWGHCVQFMGGGDFWSNPVFDFIYSFHMPLFMVISGYFFTSVMRYSFFEVVKKKTIQLLLPVVVWAISISAFVFLWWTLLYGFKVPIWVMVKETLLSIKGDLWFLKCLFSCYILSYIMKRICKNDWVACIMANLFFLLVPSFFGEIFLLPFFWMGFFMKHYSTQIENHRDILLRSSFLLYLLLFYFWTGRDTIYAAPMHTLFNWETHSLDLTNYDTAIFRFLIGAAGAMWIILLFAKYIKESSVTRRLGKWGMHTMGIYIVQYYLLQVWLSRYDFPQMPSSFYNFIATPLLAILLLFISLLCCKVLKSNRLLGFLFLGIPYLTKIKKA